MPDSDPNTVVSTKWLADHLDAPDLRILDGSWYLPGEARDPKAEYDAAHIPGARFFDIDDISDSQSDLPHMAPPPEKFMSRLRAMGVGDGHRVVVYDGAGIFSSIVLVVCVMVPPASLSFLSIPPPISDRRAAPSARSTHPADGGRSSRSRRRSPARRCSCSDPPSAPCSR